LNNGSVKTEYGYKRVKQVECRNKVETVA